MAGITEPSAPQSIWLEELADVDMDWDSISLPSTPTPATVGIALSSSTEDVASLPRGLSNADPCPALSFPADDDMFGDTSDFETFLRETEGIDFSSTTLTVTLASTPTVSKIHSGVSSSNTSAFQNLQTPKRIMRGTFPPALKSNSPIPGLTSSICLRTLFCLGEALNVGCQAARDNQDVLLEFYCRVMSSHREDNTQHFVLADLTHDNPPFINATFAS
ncbi:hypothetical protein E4T44_09409 [Aureobasidium sp. EXF-8845]|nr:hypothetical protein E4T44_09409 [Aureobasidium sp. EXF-8845]KAI4835490.1 hypothetical protein E4T45_09934 [Aureobasidium sp. EXF-8846]